MAQQAKTNVGQIVTLVIIAVILGAGYVALDFYTEGEKNKTITESRGTQISQALSKHKLEAKAYPDSLDKLVPKFAPAVPKCPGGDAFAYQAAGEDYSLGCQNVGFKMKPYSYSSKTRVWSE
jgi:hypothetical protein